MSTYLPEKVVSQRDGQQHPFATSAQEGQGYNDMYGPPPPVNNAAQQGGAPSATAHLSSYYPDNNNGAAAGPAMMGYPGARPGPPTEFLDPTLPRPNDILPLHPAIIQQRQIAATLPPCPKGGYHELRSRHALGVNAGTFLSVICFPIVCCFVRNETVCIKCQEKFNLNLPPIQ
ncbi:hypothetical protein EDD11_010597 [Mortierella claussenii]|nr:hypothetical protein EDD11_010597 [Mortierella claussenii]